MWEHFLTKNKGRLMGVGIAVVAGCLAIALFLAGTGSADRFRAPSTTLALSSHPSGATISLDGKVKGIAPLRIPVEPGEYVVSAEAEHHIPWQETVRVEKGQVERVIAHLVFVPHLTLLSSNGGSWPEWDADGKSVFYVTLPEAGGRLKKVDLSGQEPTEIDLGVEIMDPHTFGLSWNQDRSWLLAWTYSEEDLSPYLVSVDLETAERHEISGLGPKHGIVLFGDRSSHGDRLLYLQGVFGMEPAPGSDAVPISSYELWTCNARGQGAQRVVELRPDILITGIVASPGGEKVLILEPDRLWALDLDSPEPVILLEEKAIEQVLWSPDGHLVGYLEVDDRTGEQTPGVISPDGSVEKELVTRSIDYFQWFPDGSEIVYFTYDPFVDASACWTIDVETGERSLLADKSIITQRVGRFAISPDGERIAFEGGDGNIWLLTLIE